MSITYDIQQTNREIIICNVLAYQGLYSLSGNLVLETTRLDDTNDRIDLKFDMHLGNVAGVCQILERLKKSKPQTRDFEISRDLVVRRPFA